MIPYGRQEITESDIKAVISALRSDLITTGALVEEFERQLTEYIQAPTFVVNSGTAALHAAYVGIGIGPGDEIITPPNTFIATQATAAQLGAKIVFSDIDSETGLIDLECIEQSITKRTKAIVLVDYAGQPCDVQLAKTIIGKRNIKVVQDAAHSFGSFINGKPVGSQADVTTFSFFATKNITTGEGGAVTSLDDEIFQRAKEFSRQGLVRIPSRFINPPDGPWHQEVHDFGLNYRLTDFQCALGISQLSRIESIKSKRREIREYYETTFGHIQEVKRLKVKANCDPMWHLYPIFVQDKKRIFEFLRHKGIGVQVNYQPVYRHPVFAKLGYEATSLQNSEKFYREEISLPMHSGLNWDDLEFITTTVIEAT